MKKLLIASMALALSGSVFAQEVTLVCKGWGPFYKTLNSSPINERSESDSLIIQLDMKKRVAAFRTQLGQTNADFKESEKFYSGTTPVNGDVLGTFVTAIDFSINRLTGEAAVFYKFGNDGSGKVAFLGMCAPGKPLF